MKNLFILLVFMIPLISVSQDEDKFGIKFSGFVKSDIFYDSRQTVDAREGHFLLYPAAESPDINGDDINASPKFNILSIQTRLKGAITGPDAFGAKTSGLIEGAFFGNIGTDINGFRLRHAFVKLTWTNTELLVGQYWHPMFVTSCFPGTVSFNTGAPFQPFARNPQIRLKQSFGDLNLIITAMEQVDFVDGGPDVKTATLNVASPRYLINSGMPEFNARLEFDTKNDDKEFLLGIGGNYKMLTPRLQSETFYDQVSGNPFTYKVDEQVSGVSGMAYLKWKCEKLTFKLEGVMGQMMQSMTMVGGYAVKSSDTANGSMEYTPVKTMSVWTDIHTNGKKYQVGLFGGYTKNNGTVDDNTGQYYARSANIDYVYRVAPRLIINSGKFRIAPEIEYTVAAYGKNELDGTVKDAKEVANFRFLVGVFYFF
ncbi:MAG: hypothetical protein KDC05_08735 [Bacteroidales bacterium]|nr:hypothetical protein [Bacteroidales bacterium]